MIISAYRKTKLTDDVFCFFFWGGGDSPAYEFYLSAFGNTACSIFIGGVSTIYEDETFYTTYEDGTDRLFRNAEESPKRKNTKFRTRRKFEIGRLIEFVNVFIFTIDAFQSLNLFIES